MADVNPLEEVVTRNLFTVCGISITNHMFMVAVAAVLLMIILPLSMLGKGMVRKGFGNLIESVCAFIREEVARPFLGDSTDRHIGFMKNSSVYHAKRL